MASGGNPDQPGAVADQEVAGRDAQCADHHRLAPGRHAQVVVGGHDAGHVYRQADALHPVDVHDAAADDRGARARDLELADHPVPRDAAPAWVRTHVREHGERGARRRLDRLEECQVVGVRAAGLAGRPGRGHGEARDRPERREEGPQLGPGVAPGLGATEALEDVVDGRGVDAAERLDPLVPDGSHRVSASPLASLTPSTGHS